ncbi:putative transcription factor bZIP family [Helianthus annuus]|uniref:Putative bZIP transcription factor family protein n=2 Tax=Helianthus annuus TaxID=4232 RepID=A0A251SQX9_HELAN|nr:transcription factor TGA9 isoform X1 [Helianthus annuus]XP_022000527.1 transcription factor TGA9 isoform X1 [Helianthus annuus]KAF5772772.1 putative transcription factor bZIP family [Helianthus annuus]KAJ0480522.1 putative transcription factor bZIP family [Helianthus annuus]KAJ0497177.1 putative transcription factor bZIP family [Helianthus annuus]KAJ0848599.1 putative transcription factor bZIP family [Helianthus annuus]KAJ0857585.1 putative transcription factor bZIP family [Helianthus annu
MASHRVGETGLSDSGPSHHHHHHQHLPYSVFPAFNPPNTGFINQEGPSFDFGELEEAIVLQGYKTHGDETKLPLYTTVPRPAATLDMFPSWPMRIHQTSRGSNSSTDSGSAVNVAIASKPETHSHIEPESPISDNSRKTSSEHQQQQQQHEVFRQQLQHLQIPQLDMESEGGSPVTTGGSSHSQQAPKPFSEKRKGTGSTSEKTLDAKTLRRLAQNREAARKSRLRKKAYVQQLESSRIRLTQLEQDLQRARSQGLFVGGGGGGGGNLSSGAAIFDMEYSRWLDDDQRHMAELRKGLQSHLSDADLRVIVDSFVAHYDEIFQLKGVAAKSDVFHLITGMWTTPAERCFLWMGGFRPSELIKMLAIQLDPLTEQQVVGIYSLQQSSQQAEEALTQGLDQLHQSMVDTIASGSVNDGVHHMAVALGKLTNLEGFVRQADNLRQQTLHQLHRILTVRQAAKCFLVISEYYGRLRALSSLWASRPREALISDENSCQTTTDLQMVQSSHIHFSNFG